MEASPSTYEQTLRHLVLNCAVAGARGLQYDRLILDGIRQSVCSVRPGAVSGLAIECAEKFGLRYVALLLVREMARLPDHRFLVACTLSRIIRQPSDICDFLDMYWSRGREPLSAQVKKGLARAFQKLSNDAVMYYGERQRRVMLRDALFICRARPLTYAQEQVWKQMIRGGHRHAR